jgi:hypothetical protein
MDEAEPDIEEIESRTRDVLQEESKPGEEVLAEVKSCRKKHSKLAAFAQGQQEATNFNWMLWALYQDMAENPDLLCPIFQTNLGPLPKEGFYTKQAYEQVTLLFSFIFFYFNKYSSFTTIGRS